jgi:hypothetical protein
MLRAAVSISLLVVSLATGGHDAEPESRRASALALITHLRRRRKELP